MPEKINTKTTRQGVTNEKRNVSLLLSLLLVSSCCIPVSIAAKASALDSGVSPDTLLVSKSESGLHLAESSSISTVVSTQESTYVFLRESDNFYYTENGEFSSDFRVYLEDDGSLTSVEKVVLDTDFANPATCLVLDYGYSSDSKLVNDIKAALEQGFTGEISVYTSNYTDYTKYVNGKLVSTDFVVYSAMENDGGTTIARKGERGIASPEELGDVTLNLYCYESYALNQSRLGISAGSLLGLFGRTAFKIIKQAFESAPTSRPYVMLFPAYDAVMRYTNVIQNGMEYTGCVSNKVDVRANLIFYSPSGVEVDADYAVEGSFESNHFGNAAAEQAAVNNYLVGGYIDKIDDYSVVATYPNGTSKTFTFGVT